MSELKLLITTGTEYERGVVTEILKEHHLPYITKDRESGGYMRIYSGSSMWGTDIFVDQDRLNEAKELIANFLPDCDIE